MDMTPDRGGTKLATLFLPFLEGLDRHQEVTDLGSRRTHLCPAVNESLNQVAKHSVCVSCLASLKHA